MKKIPDNATKVFEGILHDVYHWEQKMFDGTTETFEALKRRDGVTIVGVTNNMILINHEEQPVWGSFITLPGGNSETEDYLADAQREFLEETGYISDDWQEWFSADITGYVKLEWSNNFFLAKNCKKVVEQKLDAGEKIDVKLVTFEEFLELRNNPTFRNKDFSKILEKAANDETERQTLKNLLGITT